MSRLIKRVGSRMTASQIMAVGFATTIFAGGLVLSMPFCNANGKWLSFVDALFSSCTSVCVTGLMTVVPAVQFTLIGKIILLILIQLGGLGIIACTMGTFLILGRRISLRDRVIIQQGYDLNTMTGIVRMLKYVIRGTFLVEGLGTAGYALQFVPEYGLVRGLWYSLFHSVSTFCNAGIDILGDNSLQNYVSNPLVNFVAVFLIITSGLGYLVWQDTVLAVRRIIRKECSVRKAVLRMKLQSKTAILMTFILILSGTVIIFFTEYTNPDTLGSLGTGEKWMAALFQSVTTRTAGFFTIPQNLFREETRLVSCFLMFIGGSPGGTAGGVKTTTVVVLLATCWSVLKGRKDTEIFHRRISTETIRTGFSVFVVFLLSTMTGTFLLLVFEPFGLMNAVYEVISAVATVGLTTGITPALSTGGKMVIIVLMYLGRLGPVTLALMFASKVGRKKGGYSLPEERLMVG